VLGWGPSVVTQLDGHAFLPEFGSSEAVGCLHPIAAKTPEGGGAVAGLTGPSPAGTIQSGRGTRTSTSQSVTTGRRRHSGALRGQAHLDG
jgi:hypothetical protein